MIPKVFDLSNWKDEDGIILTKKGTSTEKNVLLGNQDSILDLFNIEALSHSVVSDSLWTVALQALLSMGFFRQYWSGLPFPEDQMSVKLLIRSRFGRRV